MCEFRVRVLDLGGLKKEEGLWLGLGFGEERMTERFGAGTRTRGLVYRSR